MRARLSLLLILPAIAAYGQLNSFPKLSYFRETFARPRTKFELQPPVRLKDSVVDEKLSLSLKTYLELVMANNTDIAIQMLSVEQPKNAITRAFAVWDPQASASFSNTKSSTPSTGALQGASTVVSLSQPANFSYLQTLPSGTQYSVSFGASKSTTNSSFATLNPALSAGLTVNVSQPLIRNRGDYVNRLTLMMAHSRLKGAQYNLRANLLQMLNTAENTYWDLVLAHENLRVQESARKLAEDSLKLSQKQLELGAISPLDIYNPQQQLATAELGVSQARFQIEQAENALRRQIGADLDQEVRSLPIEVTETVDLPLDTVLYDAEGEVKKALANRPEIKAALQSLDIDDLGIAQAKNELLHDL
jgi:outer membrane protein